MRNRFLEMSAQKIKVFKRIYKKRKDYIFKSMQNGNRKQN